MKKLIAITLFVASCLTALAQPPDTTQINYPDFSIFYCNATANAKVVYSLYKTKLESPVKVGRASDFHATGNRPNLTKVYKGAGYDIGHYYSAKNGRYDTVVEKNTFDFANTRPQRHLLNAYRYFDEENYERSEAIKYGSLKVIAWDTGSIGNLGGLVNVPQYCWKKLIYPDSTVVFKFPNNDSVMKHPWYWYKLKS